MDWLLDAAEEHRKHIRSGLFFQSLGRVERPSDLKWIHQLIHQSREFTQALCLRYALCRDKNYQSIFAEHALEEADHPDQLAAWMNKHGFLGSIATPAVPETPALPETVDTAAYCWRSAAYEAHDTQIAANVLHEGVAFDFYSGVIPVLEGLGIMSGRYWKIHREVDLRHLRLGLDRCGDVLPGSPAGRHYLRVLHQVARLYHRMLGAWARVTLDNPLSEDYKLDANVLA